jgi:hypothetical protein
MNVNYVIKILPDRPNVVKTFSIYAVTHAFKHSEIDLI